MAANNQPSTDKKNKKNDIDVAGTEGKMRLWFNVLCPLPDFADLEDQHNAL